MNPLNPESRIAVRRRADLPRTNLGWLELTDHFVATVGAASGSGTPLGDLLVLADATLAAGSGFQLHSHRSMEVVTIVLSGAIVHREPGHELPVPAGWAQWMSAGDGITHAETNPGAVPARLLQIWLRPKVAGGAPAHHVTRLPELDSHFRRLSAAASITDATLSMAQLAPEETTELAVAAGRTAYLFLAGAAASVAGEELHDGDGAVVQSGRVEVRARAASTLVVIDVAEREIPFSA